MGVAGSGRGAGGRVGVPWQPRVEREVDTDMGVGVPLVHRVDDPDVPHPDREILTILADPTAHTATNTAQDDAPKRCTHHLVCTALYTWT